MEKADDKPVLPARLEPQGLAPEGDTHTNQKPAVCLVVGALSGRDIIHSAIALTALVSTTFRASSGIWRILNETYREGHDKQNIKRWITADYKGGFGCDVHGEACATRRKEMYYDSCDFADVRSDWLFDSVFAAGRRPGRGDSYFYCSQDAGQVKRAVERRKVCSPQPGVIGCRAEEESGTLGCLPRL